MSFDGGGHEMRNFRVRYLNGIRYLVGDTCEPRTQHNRGSRVPAGSPSFHKLGRLNRALVKRVCHSPIHPPQVFYSSLTYGTPMAFGGVARPTKPASTTSVST